MQVTARDPFTWSLSCAPALSGRRTALLYQLGSELTWAPRSVELGDAEGSRGAIVLGSYSQLQNGSRPVAEGLSFLQGPRTVHFDGDACRGASAHCPTETRPNYMDLA